jgi:uncharacterized protein
MKWQGRRQSSNVEDRRGASAKGAVIGGGLGGAGVIVVIILLLLNYCSGGGISDTSDELINTHITGSFDQSTYQATPAEDELAQFAKVIFADTEDVWTEYFVANGMEYIYPSLVLYTDFVQSGCGAASSQTGPFYCPADYKVYIDLSFFEQLQTQFNAPGDFAMAYVIAHEVGHHIQTILGIMEDVQSLQSRVSRAKANDLSVRLELQADYLAGVWAYYINKYDYLEQGDIEEALGAASAVGDDRIQKEQMGYAV